MVARISDEAFIGLAAAVALLFAADAYIVRQLRVVAQDTAHLDRYVSASVGMLRQRSAVVNDVQQESVEVLAARLAADRLAAGEEAQRARTDAQRHAGLLANRMAKTRHQQLDWAKGELKGLQTTAQEARETATSLAREVHETRAAAEATAATKSAVAASAVVVRTDVSALDSAVRNQSKEVSQLRAAGKRRIFEFNLKKDGQPVIFEGVVLKLNRADRSRNQYSLGIEIGGSRIHARNRAAQEPVRLISTRGSPIELVVAEIGEGEVRGTLSLPPRSDTATGGYSIGRADTRNLPVR